MDEHEQINTVIIEDEPLAQQKLASFISKCPELHLEKVFSNPVEALPYLNAYTESILFLDIQMDKMNGIQLLEKMVNKPYVIITTAFEEYALKGFEMNVSDYLLKPYSYTRFRQAVEKVLHAIRLEHHSKENDNAYIMVKSDYKLEKIPLRSILYVEGMKDYLRIHTIDRRYMILKSFASLEKELPSSRFVRIHKSYMVALDKIVSIEKENVVIGGVKLPIGKSYKEQFMELLLNH